MNVNRRVEPEPIAPDPYVIRLLFGEGMAPAAVPGQAELEGLVALITKPAQQAA